MGEKIRKGDHEKENNVMEDEVVAMHTSGGLDVYIIYDHISLISV